MYWAWVFWEKFPIGTISVLGLWKEFPVGPILAWICIRCSRRHHFSLDVEEKHPIENVLGTGLLEEIL